MINEIGEKISILRKSKGLTLKDMSESSGLSISFLSQVENGTSSLAITSLKKIADTLMVPITYFFEADTEHSYYISKGDQKVFNFEGSPFKYVRLSGEFAESTIEPLMMTLPPHTTIGQKYTHKGEEFLFIIEGTLTVELADKTYTVKQGEAMHYPSTIPHMWSNDTDEVTKVLSVTTQTLFR